MSNQRSFWCGVGCGASIFVAFSLVRLSYQASSMVKLAETLVGDDLLPLEQVTLSPPFYVGVPLAYVLWVGWLCFSLSRRLSPPYVAASLTALAGLGINQLLVLGILGPIQRVSDMIGTAP